MAKQKRHTIPENLLPPAPPEPENANCICGCADMHRTRIIREVALLGNPEPVWCIKSHPESDAKGAWVPIKHCPWCYKPVNTI